MVYRPLLRMLLLVVLPVALLVLPAESGWAKGKVKVWEGTIMIPTYPWEEDVNPKFWAIEGSAKLSTTVKGSITYPYTMQDHLSRTKVERTYRALFLENEYLKITCLPELGGRLHSVLDKTQGKEVFHLNRVIKPSMIAMRGAFISGGVEWNAGPQVHTVTIVSPVDVLSGHNPDGSAFLEISNCEKIFRTRWTVRLTLHPAKAYLDERIEIFNASDTVHPYYFWNCTAFGCRPGTRFIYPMTLGTDHHGREFFSWPIHKGKDLSWLKDYETWASVFSVRCEFDFFGAYDVDLDRGIVQVANHHELSGKKAWTWGNWDFGLVSQQNLTDEDGPYIEVQSGPLPTQSDYGMLSPRKKIAWREWWYPVHGLGDGFEYASKDLAVQTARSDGNLRLRLLATGQFPRAVCTISRAKQQLLQSGVDLSPRSPQVLTVAKVGQSPVDVTVKTEGGNLLASFTTPLPIPKIHPPDPSKFEEKPDEQLTVEQKYLKGRKYDLATDRVQARRYYEKALAEDGGYSPALRALAVLDIEAGLYKRAVSQLEKALDRNPNDGLSWFFLGASHLKLKNRKEAVRCAHQAARCFGTTSLGYDLAGRAYMQLGERSRAVGAFRKAVASNPGDRRAQEHLMLALSAAGKTGAAAKTAERLIARSATNLVPRALLALRGDKGRMARFVQEARAFVGEDDFQFLETSLVFAEVGMVAEARRLLEAACVEAVPAAEVSPLPLYYLAYFLSAERNEKRAGECLRRAAGTRRDFIFASRPEAVGPLSYAIKKDPRNASAHLQLGNLYANLGRLEEAVPRWVEAARVDPALSVAFRNLGLYYWTMKNDAAKARRFYEKAIAARRSDQTLFRDLAEILIADGKRREAIELLETMPSEKMRRADIIIMLAGAYLEEKRYAETIDLLESTPYFVNWEGQDITWVMFNKAHVERGRQRLAKKDLKGALKDFETALTYPENIGVGRSNKPQEAAAQYWRATALEALGRLDEARSAWKLGAAGAEGSDEQNKYRRLCKAALSAR